MIGSQSYTIAEPVDQVPPSEVTPVKQREVRGATCYLRVRR